VTATSIARSSRFRVRFLNGPAARRIGVGLAAYAALAVISVAATERLSAGSVLRWVALALVAMAAVALAVTERHAVGLVILMIYIGCVDGALRLHFGGGHSLTLARDALLGAVSVGALLRVIVKPERIRWPPLTGWVVAWIAVVAVQLFNPADGTVGHSVEALRQHLEWVPLFFFGWALMRGAPQLRVFLLLLLVIALANGIVALIQYIAGPDAVAGWGPGYDQAINGTAGISGRVFYGSDDTAHLRPFGLGSDTGFGGAVAVLAAPAALMLLSQTRSRASQIAAVALAGGVLLALVTSETRIAVVGAAAAIAAVLLLTATSRGAGIVAITAIVLGLVGWVVVGSVGRHADDQVFARYASISGGKVASTSIAYKAGTLALIPGYVSKFPLGDGLGSVGPASSTAGAPTDSARLSAESEFNFLLVEVGVPGTAVLLLFWSYLVFASSIRIRRIRDDDLRRLLAAVIAADAAVLFMWLGGPVSSSPPASPFFWFTAGILAYWCFDVDAAPARVPAFASSAR
jgi:hypothetical protein